MPRVVLLGLLTHVAGGCAESDVRSKLEEQEREILDAQRHALRERRERLAGIAPRADDFVVDREGARAKLRLARRGGAEIPNEPRDEADERVFVAAEQEADAKVVQPTPLSLCVCMRFLLFRCWLTLLESKWRGCATFAAHQSFARNRRERRARVPQQCGLSRVVCVCFVLSIVCLCLSGQLGWGPGRWRALYWRKAC